MQRYKALYLWAWLAVSVNLFTLLLEPLGRSPGVQTALRAMIKG